MNRDFFRRESSYVAKALLGKNIIRRINGKDLIGKIVETESYLPFIDPAAHSYRGKTLRTSVLFGKAGFSYVYSIHRYYCLNIVCDELNVPGCVLIRALEPLEEEKQMMINRGRDTTKNLTNGPGRLCQALQINKDQNGLDLTSKLSELQIREGITVDDNQIITTTRIGISKAKDLPLRFYIKGNKFISRL